VPARLATLADGPHRGRDGERHLHAVVLPTSAGRLLVVYDAYRTEEQVHQYGLYLLGLGVLCIAVAVAIARRLARIVVEPLDRLAGRLSGWAPGETAATAGASDEESRLLEAFGRVQARFEEAIAHEREFGANLRHELRTPLAALRTDLELLADSPDLPGPVRARLERMTGAVDALGGAFEAAGALTHRAPARPRPVELARCVDDAWLTLEPSAQTRGLSMRNRIEPRLTVVADRHALLTIVRNLLRNAAEHAAPARCTVSGDATALVVEDDGPGLPEHELPFVFERAWRGARADRAHPADPADPGHDAGRGLGLAIARRIAELNGWSLRVEPRTGGGLRFVLAFVPAPTD
jgi:signal transduction histidine kinase